jgi:hypothetical protein
MNLHWGALGQVAVVGAGASLAIVIIFACAVLALSQRAATREHGGTGNAALTAASLCFAACAAAVLYGIYLTVPQFH